MEESPHTNLWRISERIHKQEITSTEVVEACLARIEALNPQLNAFITVLADEARKQATAADQEIQAGKWRGPLHGVPVALKDMYDTAGIKTTAAFEYFKERVPSKDAVAVEKLKAAGAIIIGKTNMHTLAMGTTSNISAFGAVHNPWNIKYISGGSSGGSAVAVATEMCYATVDTDAVGSTRLPAACCGIVGYKCTWGFIDNTGILAGEEADEDILKLATAGIMTRDVRDTALVIDALTGAHFTQALDKKTTKAQRIGIATNLNLSEKASQAFAKGKEVLAALGYELVDAEAPVNESPDMSAIDAARKTSTDDIFKTFDVLVLPTLAHAVPTAEAAGNEPQALSPQYTFFANYLGLPAITVPSGFDENGLPFGLQIVGKADDDEMILHVAQAFMQATPEHLKQPDIK